MEAPQVQIDTSMGSFTVELYYKHAPQTVKNFTELARRGYYDGTRVRAAGQHKGSGQQRSSCLAEQ
jgi:cyclophilin family peptidyl-prolyl cis-trans isomerase